MSDETVKPDESGAPETANSGTEASRTRPRPNPGPPAEPVEPVEPPEPAESPKPGPASATSRARRIGGRPVVPGAPADAPVLESTVGVENTAGVESSAGKSRFSLSKASTSSDETVVSDAGRTRSRREVSAPAPLPAPAATSARAARSASRDPDPSPRLRAVAGVPVAWIPATVLGIVTLLLVILVAIAGHGVLYSKSSVSAAQRNAFSEEVLASAKTCLATINTYNYGSLDSSEKAALACTTGKLTATIKSFYDKSIKVQAPPQKAIQTAQINRAGIQSVSQNSKQVNVLAYAQLSISKTGLATPRIDVFSVSMTMDKVGNQWLVSKFESDAGASTGG
jgi:hypothetical protein